MLMTTALAMPPATAATGAKGGGPADGLGSTIVVRREGDPFCPTRTLMSGNVVIPVGCYVLSVLRDARGTFLAFAPPDAGVSPGQQVRLNTPAGPGLKARLLLMPLSTTVELVPPDTITLVAAQVQYLRMQVAIVLTGLAVPIGPIEIQEY
jgi:hypothetical protein